MNGKVFLLRALQFGGPPDRHPSPIPAPGAQEHNYKSTSSDINLYADWKTADSQSSILFLDCEGFEDGVERMPLGMVKQGVVVGLRDGNGYQCGASQER
jgi:hypothetical protein